MLVALTRDALSALVRELTLWRISGDRAVFGAQAVLSVALSVELANRLHLDNAWWAAISAFVVAQTNWSDSLHRALQRMQGTVAGACLGTLVGPWIGDRPWLFIPVMGVIGGTAVYRGNLSKAAYAWLLGGITGLMVTFEAHLLGSVKATALFALMRTCEVLVGIFSCLLVAGVFGLVEHRYLAGRNPLGPPGAQATATGSLPEWHPRTAAIALGVQGGLALITLAALTYTLSLPGLMQGMITVVAVLIFPQLPPGAPDRRAVVAKMIQRLIGCLLAGALGLALLPLMQGVAAGCMMALSLGLWLGCHVQTGHEGATYLGRQFTIAFIMVFVQDHGWSADAGPALTRLSGVGAGTVILAVVMFCGGYVGKTQAW